MNNSLLAQIGFTPLIKIDNLFVKLEYFNPSGSMKDRMTPNLIRSIKDLKTHDVVVVASSGNTAISIGLISKLLNLKSLVFVNESVDEKRLNIIKSYCDKVVVLKTTKNLEEVSEKVINRLNSIGFNYYRFLNQHENCNNYLSYNKLAREVIFSLNEQNIKSLDYFICGMGTGGTIVGVSEILKKYYPNLIVIGVLPKDCITKLYGINSKLEEIKFDLRNIDIIKYVSDYNSFKTKELFNKRGYLFGNSTYASIWEALKIEKNKNVLIIASDNNIKY